MVIKYQMYGTWHVPHKLLSLVVSTKVRIYGFDSCYLTPNIWSCSAKLPRDRYWLQLRFWAEQTTHVKHWFSCHSESQKKSFSFFLILELSFLRLQHCLSASFALRYCHWCGTCFACWHLHQIRCSHTCVIFQFLGKCIVYPVRFAKVLLQYFLPILSQLFKVFLPSWIQNWKRRDSVESSRWITAS